MFVNIRARILRKRDCIYTLIQSCGIIRHTNKSERTVKMSFYRMIQYIGVVCGVSGPPLQADNVTLFFVAHGIYDTS